jgi:hypothetical protein
MTVRKVVEHANGEFTVYCQWFADDKHHEAQFPGESLQRIKDF